MKASGAELYAGNQMVCHKSYFFPPYYMKAMINLFCIFRIEGAQSPFPKSKASETDCGKIFSSVQKQRKCIMQVLFEMKEQSAVSTISGLLTENLHQYPTSLGKPVSFGKVARSHFAVPH